MTGVLAGILCASAGTLMGLGWAAWHKLVDIDIRLGEIARVLREIRDKR